MKAPLLSVVCLALACTKAAADYGVNASPALITIVDGAGQKDTLTISESSPEYIRFAAPGRSFIVNGVQSIAGNSGDFPLSSALTAFYASAWRSTARTYFQCLLDILRALAAR